MPNLAHPDMTVDGLLRSAAVRDPEGLAVRTEHGAWTFGELDALADRIAAFVRRETGRRPGARVGVASVLDPVFAAAYHGVARGGATVVLINPLIGDDGLRHVTAAAGVELALVPSATAARLARLRGALPALETVVVTDPADDGVPAGCLPLGTVLDGPAEPALGRPGGADPDAVACVQFTTGTTGLPKGVLLTHRNLVANARQTALAHGLGPGSVTVNHLPLYHVMHLNSALDAGACQVLCQDPDPVTSLAVAAGTGATHYYGLPARLHRLAADERLPRTAPAARGGTRLTAVLSGGSALLPEAARTLGDLLGVPVVQGYGMAELSPLTHCQRPGSPHRPGTVGTPVPGTECRLVDLATRRPVEPGSLGEVQVTGPQLMAGYLGEQAGSHLGPDGWFSTGDIGSVDDDGALRLVDRVDDIFKYDNEIVSPGRVERVLARDPRVADCVVAGLRDPEHGRAAWAGVVLREEPGARAADDEVLRRVVARANEQLAPFEHIRAAEVLSAVPRTPTGKPARGRVRQTLAERAAFRSRPALRPFDLLQEQTMVTFVNKLTVHGDLDTFLAVKHKLTAYMAAQPGYVSHQVMRHAWHSNVYLELAVWEDADAHQKAVRSDEFQSLVKQLGPLASPEPGLFETVEASA
ncbi:MULTISPECIES: AMP-binding protein [unclassified Streptomyces]|uniref:AMP-binding protein n=1 Tax=unclassified Streptomyces TaxID=2593676 RepID=UPI0024427F51|nr:AMP-binding protein [Streptomyces sp. DH41]MDG9723659.1 AMP-binding protein [Streptomyces sp. DH41]